MVLLFLRVTVKYHGKASHASAYPWEGVNALDAAVLAYNNLSALRQQLKPEWRLHGEEQKMALILNKVWSSSHQLTNPPQLTFFFLGLSK